MIEELLDLQKIAEEEIEDLGGNVGAETLSIASGAKASCIQPRVKL